MAAHEGIKCCLRSLLLLSFTTLAHLKRAFIVMSRSDNSGCDPPRPPRSHVDRANVCNLNAHMYCPTYISPAMHTQVVNSFSPVDPLRMFIVSITFLIRSTLTLINKIILEWYYYLRINSNSIFSPTGLVGNIRISDKNHNTPAVINYHIVVIGNIYDKSRLL